MKRKRNHIEDDGFEKKRRKKNPFINDSNVFNDPSLDAPFEWKKNKKVVDNQLKRELHEDLVRIRQVKHQRELEKRISEENRIKLERERNMLRYQNEGIEDPKNEEIFVLKQSKLRSTLRIQRGRTKPIDIISQKIYNRKRISFPPHQILKNLSHDEVKELLGDVKMNMNFDREETKEKFWVPFKFLCERKLKKLAEKKENDEFSGVRRTDEGIHDSVKKEIKSLLFDKTYAQLLEMEQSVRMTLEQPNVEVEYWESLLKHLDVWKARRMIIEFNESLPLDQNLQDDEKLLREVLEKPVEMEKPEKAKNGIHDVRSKEEFVLWSEKKRKDYEESLDDEEIDAETDFNKTNEGLYKPLMNNRVVKGFEWSRYNRAHYDETNLPPTIPMKYRFAIHYPEAKNPPVYKVTPIDKMIAKLTIHAGEPYKDVAFRVVNKEWDRTERRGYRCSFDRGVFTLRFSLKKLRFRR